MNVVCNSNDYLINRSVKCCGINIHSNHVLIVNEFLQTLTYICYQSGTDYFGMHNLTRWNLSIITLSTSIVVFITHIIPVIIINFPIDVIVTFLIATINNNINVIITISNMIKLPFNSNRTHVNSDENCRGRKTFRHKR